MLRCKPSGTGFASVPSGLTRLCCALAFLATASFTLGATWTWTGAGGTSNWSTGGNWNLGSGPTSAATTDLIFAGTNNTGTALVPLNQNIASPFQLNNLTFASGSGSFFLGGNPLAFTGAARTIRQNSDNAQSIANTITASTNSTVVLTLTGDGAGVVTLSGPINAGSGSRNYAITKTGTSTFSLTGASNYGGVTTVSEGVLNIRNGTALGSISSGTTVASGATLQIQGGITVGTEALTLNGSGIASDGAFRNISGNNSFAGSISLASATTITSDAGTLTLTGGIANGLFTTTFGGAGNIAESGAISGLGGLIKTGNGTLTLSGPNTFRGGTTINGGTVAVSSDANLGGLSSSVTLNAGTLEVTTSFSTLRLFTLGNAASTFQVDAGQTFTVNLAITGSGTLNKTGSGTMVLSVVNLFSGGTNVTGGTLQLGAIDRLLTTAAITISGGAFDLQTFTQTAGAVTLSSGSITGTGKLTASSFVLQSGTVNAILAGTGTVTKNTAGTVTLSGANTFTGSTTISAGTLQVNTNNALGTAASGTTVANGAVLKLNNVNYSTAEPLTLNGGGISNGGALSNTGTSTFAGPINAATNATINAGGGTLNLTGGVAKNGTTLTIAGGGTVNITNNGITGSAPNSDLMVDGTTVVLSAASSYNGPTTVQNSGTLKLGGNNMLPASPQTAMTVNTGSIFDLASYSDGVASLTGDSSAIVKNSAVGGISTLTINPASGVSTTFAGVISGTNGGTQGNIALQKNGAGTLILTGSNTFSGTTTVSGGTLTAAASSGTALGSTSSITVNSGGTLMLGANNQISDAAPMTLAGGTFGKGNFGEGSAGTLGLGALSLTASGSQIDFGSGTVGVLTFASFTPGSFTLNIANWTGTPGAVGNGSTDRLIFNSNQGANLGSFAFDGYSGAMAFDLGNGYYEITPVTAVPEPSTYIAAVLGLTVMLLHRRKCLRRLVLMLWRANRFALQESARR